MCGRAYSTFTEEELALRYLNKKPRKLPELAPNYNFSPTQTAPVIRADDDGNRSIELFHWQFIPPWEPEFKTKLSTINAKSETVFESRLYKGAVLRHRCIVPLSGFFEWKRAGDKKQPFAVHLKAEPIMSVAGIFSVWRPKDGPARYSFALMTTQANGFMKKIHDRMPVILDQKAEEAWLDSELQDEDKIKRLLKPCPDKWLTAHEVSTMVNSPRNNRPECIKSLIDES